MSAANLLSNSTGNSSSSNCNNDFYFDAINEIIKNNNLRELKKLLKRRRDFVVLRNHYSQTPLHIAAIEGKTDILKFLIEKKSDINAQDRQGWTAIFCACNSDQLELVEILLNYGADLRIYTVNGSTILHYFVRMHSQITFPILYDKVFYMLMSPQYKLDINHKNQQGETPLHMASFHGKERVVNRLLAMNADCNITNSLGETCLHLATRAGHTSILKKLIDNNANFNIIGKYGSIFDIAVTCNYPEIVKFLEGAYSDNMKEAWLNYENKLKENSDFVSKPRFSYQFSAKFEKLIPDDNRSEKKNDKKDENFLSTSPPTSPTSSSSPLAGNNNNNAASTVVHLRRATVSSDETPKKRDLSKRRVPLWRNRSKKKIGSPAPSVGPPDTAGNLLSRIPLKNFSSQRYEFCEVIGKGGFSQVFRALDKSNGQILAIKRMEIANTKKSVIDSSMTELNLLKRLKSEQIVKYVDFFRDRNFMYLVMEYVEKSLRQLIDSTPALDEIEIAKIVFQMLVGLDYLHRRGVIHRDIKAANILVNRYGVVKLADFGVAYVPESQAGLHSIIQSIKAEELPTEKPKELLGSPYWMAPEVILVEKMSIKSDIWSLGCTIIEIITKSPPFYELDPVAALFAISGNTPPTIPPNISPELSAFITRCLEKNPSDRPTSRELATHSFILKHSDLLNEFIEKSPFNDQIKLKLLGLSHSPSPSSSSSLSLLAELPPPLVDIKHPTNSITENQPTITTIDHNLSVNDINSNHDDNHGEHNNNNDDDGRGSRIGHTTADRRRKIGGSLEEEEVENIMEEDLDSISVPFNQFSSTNLSDTESDHDDEFENCYDVHYQSHRYSMIMLDSSNSSSSSLFDENDDGEDDVDNDVDHENGHLDEDDHHHSNDNIVNDDSSTVNINGNDNINDHENHQHDYRDDHMRNISHSSSSNDSENCNISHNNNNSSNNSSNNNSNNICSSQNNHSDDSYSGGSGDKVNSQIEIPISKAGLVATNSFSRYGVVPPPPPPRRAQNNSFDRLS